MKKIVISIIVIVFIIFCFTACTYEGIIFEEEYENAGLYLCGNQKYTDKITNIDISWKNGLVKLIQSDDEIITIEEENDLDDSKKVHTYVENETLYIKYWQSGKKDKVKAKDKHLTIKYPKCQNINIVGSSCIIAADDIDCESLNVISTSGEIVVENINCNTLSLASTSGAISIGNINATNVDLGTTSGKISLGSVNVSSLIVGSTSGSFNCGSVNVNDLKFDTTSGSFNAKVTQANTIKISSTSGSVDMSLGDLGASINYETNSGSLSCEPKYSYINGEIVIGDGACDINIKTTSGSIKIRG